ncbi:CPBP family glutamic-type intramembrane protease [Ulvibacter antarcticus]|uniref:Membrane protease YdiL (CAAX protease family) n=1 Tax=Ulvibacter antarcticus TaxID=442714 RepID=A0A3L9Z1U2_9FLAO|nr:CPBP family glutamic-type intramembrane protease [Ulvibacter antarcticus]RMA64255.1 membrane protease YdiL (CAAX protease family) [Ulvibacter antarcticus]
MLKKTVSLVFILLTFNVFSQNINVDDLNSNEAFVTLLSNSKDLKYDEILASYDAFLKSNLDNIEVQVYRCKFIGSAYYDTYEDYDLNYEKTEACQNTLFDNYPKHPDVILYKLETLWGDEKGVYLDEILDEFYKETTSWNDKQEAELFESAAYQYEENDDNKAISYAEKALLKNDSLDLSVMLARAYIREGKKEEAKTQLLSTLEFDSEAWVLSQKGELLIELDETDTALEIFDRVEKKDSSYVNNESLYKIFLKNGDPEYARSFLLKDTLNEYNKSANLQALLKHDMDHSNGETALAVYRKLQEESYFDDFFGIKRFEIFLKAPFQGWSINEISHIPLLLLLFLVLLVLPYIWVLPVYALGKFFRSKRFTIKTDLPNLWGLKHFWLISFVYLLAQVLLVLVYYYADYMNYFFDVTYSYLDEISNETDILTANSIIFFTCSTFVLTLLFLNKKRLHYIFNSKISIIRMLVLSWGFVILNGIILRILGSFIDLTDVVYYITSLDIEEEISVLIAQRGFILTAILVAGLVPFYEEIIFRGIILSSTEKHIGFVKANIFQAALFATVHFNLGLFIFYFIFGLITGYTAKRTNGLLTGIIFHAVNNFLVVWALYNAYKLVSG